MHAAARIADTESAEFYGSNSMYPGSKMVVLTKDPAEGMHVTLYATTLENYGFQQSTQM